MIKFIQKYWFNIAAILILCGVSFGAGWWVNEESASQSEKLLKSAYRQVTGQSIFNAQPNEEVAYAGIRGMLASIGDPYAALIEPESAKNLNSTFSGQTGVVGLFTANQNKQVVISIVYSEGAADQAGIRVGDILLAIDGVTLDQDTNSSETGLMMRGLPGTKVDLKIMRDGQVHDYNLVRKEQVFVTSRMLDSGIGYVSLTAYNQTASQQMKLALETLISHKPVGLVWDLRNNEGGDMQAAQDILSYFIKDGLLFTAKLTDNRTVEFRAKGNAIAGDIPLVVLIDKTTYSAAETSAAAIAETGRGKTIGSTTFGKGVIQATMPLPGGSMLQMTVAKWLTPKGEWTHGKGVSPQIEVSNDPATRADEVLEKAVNLLLPK